jgi:hypothetical protein
MPRVLPSAANPQLELPGPKDRRRQSPKLERAKPAVSTLGRLSFAPPAQAKPAKSKRACPEQGRREPRPKAKNDPKLVAAARELRDRWLERVNADPSALLPHGKYDVSKELTAAQPKEILQLPRAIAA